METFVTWNSYFSSGTTSPKATNTNNYRKPYTILNYDLPTSIFNSLCYSPDNSKIKSFMEKHYNESMQYLILNFQTP